MSAPPARTAEKCTPLTVAWVPTGMKAGVRTTPCAVAISPTRAAPSVAKTRKPKPCSVSMRPQSIGREAYHDFRVRKGAATLPSDLILRAERSEASRRMATPAEAAPILRDGRLRNSEGGLLRMRLERARRSLHA